LADEAPVNPANPATTKANTAILDLRIFIPIIVLSP
jgi:hypothetical protein